jgi:predicted alpha/beta-fold hydrolase
VLTYFKTRDGLELPALLFQVDKESRTRLGAVLVHGKGGSFFEKHLTTIAAKLSHIGIPSLTFNNRGSGEADHAREFFDDCVSDIAGAIDELKQRSGCREIVLLGHSYGGLKASYYAAVEQCPAALVLMSAIPALKLSEELVSIAENLTDEGKESMIFSHKEGNEFELYQAHAILRNHREGYQGVIYDLLSKISCPMLSFASETEWDWFHEVPSAILVHTEANQNVKACLLPNIGDHCYTGYENRVAEFVSDWCKKLSDIHISKSTA